jgi:DNA mismatch repair protein MutS
LHEDAPNTLAHGNVIAADVSTELDDLRELKQNAEGYLNDMRQREAERTGITSLKIGYNKVFGYYLEITNAHKDKAPDDYIRKQTLTNAERYITPELKEFEEKILSASERILSLESRLYTQLLRSLQPHIEAMQQNANVVGAVDVLTAFAIAAERHRYTRPDLYDESELHISAGRHPVIERLLPPDAPYVPNDVQLNCEARQILLITGPNMAGKSALLRQVALITLMAQMGSFVPADAAQIGVVDKIFTRVGATDNVSAGESTFMVEMNEAARILNNATDRSLILLDEIGRGTSTFDGVSIAWALVEYLHNKVGAKTLFATHYHELATLGEQLERVHNVNVRVEEISGKIIFVRKLEAGHSAHSFGINVAQMAGLPPAVVERAQDLLGRFEAQQFADGPDTSSVEAVNQAAPSPQMQLFAVQDAETMRIKELLEDVDINRLTPVEALLKLQELQSLIGRRGEDRT